MVNGAERKTLLAAGAAAGMAATFGCAVSAVLLGRRGTCSSSGTRPRSLIPSLPGHRNRLDGGATSPSCGSAPIFAAVPDLAQPSGAALSASTSRSAPWSASPRCGVTKLPSTRSKTPSSKLPIHWMWWPALGGLVVGAVGYFSPHTMGVGYDNIDAHPRPDALDRPARWRSLIVVWKLIS